MIGAANLPSSPEPGGFLRDQGSFSALMVVGGIALVFVVYLLIDGYRSRRASRRLQLKRELAREAWEEEQRENDQRS